MREIKFRGKRLDNGEWVVGSYIEAENRDRSIAHQIIPYKAGLVIREVDPATVGQYTGLKDKNGREIYEGDIIGGSNGSINGWEWPFKSEVKWNDEECGFNPPILGYMDSTHYYNVLGNIHDNPDLLKTE